MRSSANSCHLRHRYQSQPQSVTVFTNATAQFRATASGTAPLLYQWQLNGTNVNLLSDSANFSGANSNILTDSQCDDERRGFVSVDCHELTPAARSAAMRSLPLNIRAWWVNGLPDQPILPMFQAIRHRAHTTVSPSAVRTISSRVMCRPTEADTRLVSPPPVDRASPSATRPQRTTRATSTRSMAPCPPISPSRLGEGCLPRV